MNLKEIKVGIIGYGEIGKSLETVYKQKGIQPYLKDLYIESNMLNCDFLHICIPYMENYVRIVSDYIHEYRPKNVIIHSTVDVGTTSKIIEFTHKNVCHCPIRGLHPNLDKGIQTFLLYIGTASKELFTKVNELFLSIGIPETYHCDKPETTELAKLLDTTYYGVCIAFHKEVKELCDRFDLNFEEVMTRYNETYNQGYPKLGKSNVVRLVLKDMPGPIGGHCVVPNAEILSKIWKSPVLDLILKHKS